jgi:hypothetical protein
MGALGSLTRKIGKRKGVISPVASPYARSARIDPRPATGFYSGMTEEQQLKAITVGEIQPSHGNRYESHGLKFKGRVFNGECNRAACDGRRAVFYNKGTYSYYCAPCAREINGAWRGADSRLCIQVTENLTHERMNELAREQYA